jgi:hypothetical protein
MIRFTADLARCSGDPVWWLNVEMVYHHQLTAWLVRHHYEYDQVGNEFTVNDSAYTALVLWAPVPELILRVL